MLIMRVRAFTATIAVAFVGMSSSSAYAYLDPGTGSLILQVLLGGVAGLALAGRLYWHKLLSVFGLRKDEAELPGSDRTPAADARERR